jgi:glycosyltransferase involved in cell wall biosynthesis
MNILQVSPAYFPAVSIGGPIYSTLSFSEILEKNHTLTTLTTQQGLTEVQLPDISYNKPVSLSKNHTLIYQKYVGPSNFTFSFSMIFWLLKNAANYDLLILQGVWNFPIIISAFFARLFRVPYIIFPHGSLYQETVFLKSSRIKKIVYFLAVKNMLKKAKWICFTTKDEEVKVKEFLQIPLNSFIVPNVVKSSDFAQLPERGKWRKQFSIPSETILLLHLGRISRKKGIIFTLYALRALLNKGFDVQFLLAGGDEEGYQTVIENKMRELNLEKVVHFTGLLNRTESLQAFSDSDIFVLPSLSENFGISIVEAMYCGLPVLISNQVGIASDIQTHDAGIVFDMNGIEDNLEKALEKLLLNPKQRRHLAEQGKIFAQSQYDSPVLESLINQLLQSAIL